MGKAISYGGPEAGRRKGCCIGSLGQDTVPVCPGVSQELGYLYRSSWPLLGVTQARHDGQMETCFEDGLMGGWGWGTLPASIPRCLSPRSLGAAPPGQTPREAAAETSWPVLGSARATQLHSPPCHPGVPKPITVVQPGLTDPPNPPLRHHPVLQLAVPKGGDSIPQPRRGGFLSPVCPDW